MAASKKGRLKGIESVIRRLNADDVASISADALHGRIMVAMAEEGFTGAEPEIVDDDDSGKRVVVSDPAAVWSERGTPHWPGTGWLTRAVARLPADVFAFAIGRLPKR